METKIYEASLLGDVQALNALLHQDQLILDRLSLTKFNETPLHIAAMRGHHQFAVILLTQKQRLAVALDSQRRTPLHLASANGHLETVQELVRAGGRDVCCFKDQDGLTPLHLAAMNEHVEVVKELVKANPDAAKEIAETGETIWHMCVSYNSLESLKVLMELWREDELAKITDQGGNTLLHVAAINKKTQILKYLLGISNIKDNGNAVNKLGLTALDVLDQCPRDLKSLETREILMQAGVLRANDLSSPSLPKPIAKSPQHKRKGFQAWARYVNNDHHWIEQQRGILITAALLVAAISFYSGINPPDSVILNSQNGRFSYQSEMDDFNKFAQYTSLNMAISLAIFLVLISGVSLNNKFWVWLLTIGTLFIMGSMVSNYWESLTNFGPDGYVDDTSVWILIGLLFVCGVFGLIHTAFFVAWVVMKLLKMCCRTPKTDRKRNPGNAGEV